MNLPEYQRLRALIIDLGYEHDIEWAQNVGQPETANQFVIEYIYVVCNSGMKWKVARSIFEKVMAALQRNEHPSTVFGHQGKCGAIWTVWNDRHQWFDSYLKITTDAARVEFLQTMPWIGEITKWHLAKNFGLDVVKPDRHLVRIGRIFNQTPDHLCRVLAESSGDRIGTVDYVLWRAASIGLIGPSKASAVPEPK